MVIHLRVIVLLMVAGFLYSIKGPALPILGSIFEWLRTAGNMIKGSLTTTSRICLSILIDWLIEGYIIDRSLEALFLQWMFGWRSLLAIFHLEGDRIGRAN